MLEALAEGLVLLNVEIMAYADERGVELPHPYDSGVVYRRECAGREWWETTRDMLGVVKDRSGDCEDLAAYLAAWLRYYEDEDAVVRIARTSRGTFHAIVQHEDGSFEDPSIELLHIESEQTGVPIESLYRRESTDKTYCEDK